MIQVWILQELQMSHGMSICRLRNPIISPFLGMVYATIFLVKVGTFMDLPDHFNERHIRIFVGHLISPWYSPENSTTGRYITVYPHVGSLGYRISQKFSASQNPSLAQSCAVLACRQAHFSGSYGAISLFLTTFSTIYSGCETPQGSPRSGDWTTKHRDLII